MEIVSINVHKVRKMNWDRVEQDTKRIGTLSFLTSVHFIGLKIERSLEDDCKLTTFKADFLTPFLNSETEEASLL